VSPVHRPGRSCRLGRSHPRTRHGLASRQQRQQADAAQYDQIAAALNLAPCTDEAAFVANRQRAAALGLQLEQAIETAAEQLRQAQIEENGLLQALAEVKQELDSLRGRSSQIPIRNLRLRHQILDALAIAEADVPFVGELLQVRDDERVWEGAVERLLHNFGLRLLVPERHYDRFVNYVNQHHLNGRIVFHRVAENGRFRSHQQNNPQALRHKLEIKPDTLYYDWLENELNERYDYTCCETMADFNRTQRAITKTGLSKSGNRQNARYEKDDRRRLDDRRSYVLGWHNEEKVRALQTELRRIDKQLQQAKHLIQQAKQQQTESRSQQNRLHNLLAFADFAQLDWRSNATHVQQLAAQKTRLEQSSDRLKQLQAELTQIQEQLSVIEPQANQKNGDLARFKYQIDSYEKQLRQVKELVQQADNAAMSQYAPRIQAQVAVKITLENVDSQWHGVNHYFQKTMDSEQRRANSHMGRLLRHMQEYKDAYEAETADFDASVESIPEFERELARIERDDLPKYRDRFRRMRDEKVIEAIALFQADLHKYVEEIQENIADLNQSLRTIDYTPDTYIQLRTENSRVPEIREFRQLLKDCLVDVGQQRTEAAYEASFAKVRDLIGRFKEDTRWTNKVTDVRQWLDFAAIEYYRADNSEKHYYSDSSGKSGGQKAKLAYTILASAIAFQFGLEQDKNRAQSFRFVVIDEAFSRSDENNSRYAMQLFQKLDLQLLVVTPMTGIHIVEPFINACHVVWNNSEGNHSQVYSMPIQEFQAQRDGFHVEG
ncbi:MAG: SbcC/MukB-like Walker B domain-containing protein, partial [Chloroflexota bacterium]